MRTVTGTAVGGTAIIFAAILNLEHGMPYYIYIITANESSHSRSVSQVSEFDSFKAAKAEVKRLRAEQPLAANQMYKVIFADTSAAAEKSIKEVREQPIAREWEK